MSERDFFLPSARERVSEAIRRIEAETAAEVVVAVRHHAAAHHATSLWFGAAAGALALLVMLVSPQLYDVRTMPLDAALAFGLGFVVSSFVTGLRRALTPERRLALAAEKAARRAFDERGLAETRERTAVLVFVALFERRTVVVHDQGIPEKLLGADYDAARLALSAAARQGDFAAFVAALERLGPVFAEVLPRRPDDTNELSDQVL